MFAIPMMQNVAMRRRGNFVRQPAYSGEPVERHSRLSENQFDQLVDLRCGESVIYVLSKCYLGVVKVLTTSWCSRSMLTHFLEMTPR